MGEEKERGRATRRQSPVGNYAKSLLQEPVHTVGRFGTSKLASAACLKATEDFQHVSTSNISATVTPQQAPLSRAMPFDIG